MDENQPRHVLLRIPSNVSTYFPQLFIASEKKLDLCGILKTLGQMLPRALCNVWACDKEAVIEICEIPEQAILQCGESLISYRRFPRTVLVGQSSSRPSPRCIDAVSFN